jgi:hypothetical protein
MVDTVGQALGRPMPRADAAEARHVAARMAGLSAELRRVHQVLSSAAGRDVGWAGAAELAFQESIATQLAGFAPVVQRLEGYVAALAGYAHELEFLGPRLLVARSRLANDLAGVEEFERHWQDWDVARHRCMAGLAAAPTGHRHVWSGLVSTVSRTVQHGVGLAGLSRALGDLGQALAVAGLVLALVCPPAAGAVWATLAVVAVCQLAVDTARRERGEEVGLAGLGWEALAALPGAWLASDVHSAAEASAAIERLAPDLRSSRLVPGGGLAAHEGTATYRGHTLLKHVGETPSQLAKRFETEPWLTFSSSFSDRAVAETAVAKAIQDNPQAIDAWLASKAPSVVLHTDVGIEVGKSVAKDGTIISTSKVRVILKKEETMLGYYVKTAHPTP